MASTPSGLRKASSAVTSYRAQSPGTEGVGFRTHQFRCDNTDGQGLSSAAADFLLASRIGRGDMEFNVAVGDYFVDPMIVTYGEMDRDSLVDEGIGLPQSSKLRVPLEQVIARRRSGSPLPSSGPLCSPVTIQSSEGDKSWRRCRSQR